MKTKENISLNKFYKTNSSGISLIVLVITMVFFYDKLKKCSNSNSFLLLGI